MNAKNALAAAALAALAAGGCAPKNWDAETDGAYDIFEPFNRQTHKFNKGIDWLILKPVARAYRFAPAPARQGAGNFLGNLKEPANAANNLMQRQGDAMFNSVARFVFNTTFGVGGVFDVASAMGIERREADFGQTLRGYGFNNTTYIVLPLLGPSTLADGVGAAADSRLSPATYVNDNGARAAIYVLGGAHRRAELLDATDLAEEIALDEYSFIRDAYEDRRRAVAPTEVWDF